MKKIIVIILVLAFAKSIGQDLHFSQFNEHTALINPALTGVSGNVRMLLGYKNQWRSVSTPYKTYGASFELQAFEGGWKKANQLPKKHREQKIGRLGGGLSIYRDKAGESDFGLTQTNLSLATYVPTGHWSFLSFGIQSSIAFKKMDGSSLMFPNQYNGLGYDVNMGSGEDLPLERYRYFDFAAGALWSYKYVEKSFSASRYTSARFGFSCYHLTQPNLRVIGRAAERLYMKYVVHGDVLFSVKKSDIALAPSFLVQLQGPYMEAIAGMTVKYYLKGNNAKFTSNVKSTSLNFGAFYRSKDAAILQIQLDKEETMAFGLSYDLNISPLRTASKLRGGLEFTFRYTPQERIFRQKH